MFACVPFNPDWVQNDKADLKAIYRRPRMDARTNTVLRDEAGTPLWDLTGPLPVRRHLDWQKKGFEYVTLADLASLGSAAGWLQSQGLDPKSFIIGMGPRRSPWSAEAYAASQATDTADVLKDLRELVKDFGIEAVTKIKRQTDPGWQPPAGLVAKGVKA